MNMVPRLRHRLMLYVGLPWPDSCSGQLLDRLSDPFSANAPSEAKFREHVAQVGYNENNYNDPRQHGAPSLNMRTSILSSSSFLLYFSFSYSFFSFHFGQVCKSKQMLHFLLHKGG